MNDELDGLDKILDEYFSDRTTAKVSGGTRTTAHRRAIRRLEALCQSKCIEARIDELSLWFSETGSPNQDLDRRGGMLQVRMKANDKITYVNLGSDFFTTYLYRINELSAGRWAASPSHPKATKGQKE